MPARLAAGRRRPLSGPTYMRPSASRRASGRRGPPTPGSTIARWTPTGMNPIVFARTSAPWSTDVAGIPCVMSMICVSGAIRLMTPWHVPTKSSFSPKSLRNVMNTPRSVTPPGVRSYLRLRPARRAATRRTPTRLAAQAHPARPDPDERGRRLQRQRVSSPRAQHMPDSPRAGHGPASSGPVAATWRARARRALPSRAGDAPVSRR